MVSCSPRILLLCALLCCALFIVSLVLAFKLFPDIIYYQVNQNVRLERGTDQFDRFEKLPFPVDFKIYFFNVNNPQEVLLGAKPNVTEIGPFVYKQNREKNILYTDSDEDTISFTQMEKFTFDSKASGELTLDTKVTILNLPLMSIYQLAESFYMSGVADYCVRSTFDSKYQDYFITAPVKDLLFKGYNFCKNDKHDACSLANNIFCASAETKRNADQLEDMSLMFSLFNFKARTHDGKYTVKRGMDDVSKLGHIIRWNDAKYTKYWGANTTCSEVKGTDSTLYPPRIEKDDDFYVYSTDICRAVKISYIKEDSYKGIDGYLFGTNPQTLLNSTKTLEDDCYCLKKTKGLDGKDSCFLDGTIDMQSCFGVPVLFSFPHFLWAKKYEHEIDGLSPDEDIHKTFLLVEPNTGTPLQGVKRIQLNMILRPIFGIKALQKSKRVMLPILWIEEGISLTDKYIDVLNDEYFNKVQLVDGLKYGLIALTAVLTIATSIFYIRKRSQEKEKY